MTLKILKESFSVCRLASIAEVDLSRPFTFLSVTDEEVSLVCPQEHVPCRYLKRADGWRAFKVQGELDFSLTGILAGLSGILAEKGIAVFALSTYNTDYVLCGDAMLPRAINALEEAGHLVLKP